MARFRCLIRFLRLGKRSQRDDCRLIALPVEIRNNIGELALSSESEIERGDRPYLHVILEFATKQLAATSDSAACNEDYATCRTIPYL